MFVIVNIGRNVAGRPMSVSRWDAFTDATFATISAHGSVVGNGEGESQWGEEVESFVTYHAEIPDRLALANLRTALAHVASDFDQEAIGVVASDDTSLVLAQVRPATEAA